MKRLNILVTAFALLWTGLAAAAGHPGDGDAAGPHSHPTIEMDVDGLVCAFCAQGIEKKLRKQDATADVLVSLEHKLVAVALKPDQDISDATLKDLLTEAGYTLRNVRRTAEPLDAIRKRVAQ